jgi:hypothetical protein
MTGPRWSALAAAIDGEVDLRGSPEHARRARAFNARFDHLEPEGLPRVEVTSDVWCWEAPLEGCAPCPSPIRGSSART